MAHSIETVEELPTGQQESILTRKEKESQITFDGANVAQLTDLGINLEAIEDKIIILLDRYKSGYECKECDGKGTVRQKIGREDVDVQCPTCRGIGHTVIIPQNAKSLPTSGIVVSLGEGTKAMKAFVAKDKEAFDACKIKIGTRVIMSPHVGTMLPFKGNVRLKIVREHEPLAIMYGADTAARDFLEYDKEF